MNEKIVEYSPLMSMDVFTKLWFMNLNSFITNVVIHCSVG